MTERDEHVTRVCTARVLDHGIDVARRLATGQQKRASYTGHQSIGAGKHRDVDHVEEFDPRSAGSLEDGYWKMAHRNLVVATSIASVIALLGGVEQPADAAEPMLYGFASGGSSEPLAAISVGAVKYYKDKCLTCHGVRGEGDGAGAEKLDPKPRSFSDKSWQESVSDQDIRTAITKGGVGVGKSAGMPAFPDLAKPKKKETLDGLVALIRAFGK